MAWNRHAIAQTQLRRRHRVDGVGWPKFDFHRFTPQPDAPIALYALVCYCHRLQHYVAYVKRQTSDAFLFFNDLPHLSGGARPSRGSKSKYANAASDGPPEMRAAVTWDEAVRTCGRQHLQPRLVLYEDASHPSVARALDAIGGRK